MKKENPKIKSRMIIEVLGHPPEALTKALEKIMNEVKNRANVLKQEFAEPKKVGEKMLYSAFVEFECEVERFQDFIGLIIDFGPTSIEIIEPEKIEMGAQDLQAAINDLIMKFQEFTNKLRATNITNILLQKKLQQKLPQESSKKEPKTP